MKSILFSAVLSIGWGVGAYAQATEARFAGRSQTYGEAVGEVKVLIVLDSKSDQDLWIPYELSGSAKSNIDFQVIRSESQNENKVLITAGNDSGEIRLKLLDDAIGEPSENLVITLRAKNPASPVSPVSIELKIKDNDSFWADDFHRIKSYKDLVLKAAVPLPLPKGVNRSHPQGLLVSKGYAYLTSQDKSAERAVLMKYDFGLDPDAGWAAVLTKWMDVSAEYKKASQAQPTVFRSCKPQHPGGIAFGLASSTMWFPLAGPDDDDQSVVVSVDEDLNSCVLLSNGLTEHFGTILCDSENHCVHLIDYDIDVLTSDTVKDGTLHFPAGAQKFTPKDEFEYQDCKAQPNSSGQYFLCAGKLGPWDPDGVLDLIEFDAKGTYRIVHRVELPTINEKGVWAETWSRDIPPSYNAFDFEYETVEVSGKKAARFRFYFAPHDDEATKIFVYETVLSKTE